MAIAIFAIFRSGAGLTPFKGEMIIGDEPPRPRLSVPWCVLEQLRCKGRILGCCRLILVDFFLLLESEVVNQSEEEYGKHSATEDPPNQLKVGGRDRRQVFREQCGQDRQTWAVSCTKVKALTHAKYYPA